jgi:hypothetical protein
MSHTKNVKGADVLNNAFNSAYSGGDGVELIGTHTLLNGSSIANEPTVAADLNETSLEAALIDISKFTDERGLKIAVKGQSLCVPSDLIFVAEKVLGTDRQLGSNNNDINALNSMGVLSGGVTVNHYLTDVDAWFIKTDSPNGLKHFNRVGMKTGMEGDFETGNVRYKARERYSFGWSDFRAVYGSPGA